MRGSLLDELGLDEQTLTWRQLALCGGRNPGDEGMDLNWFFDDYENDKELAAAMDDVCLSCPVMKQCLAEAIQKKDYGLRGGIFLANGKVDKEANSHKTEEVWEKIEEKVYSG
jgi:hypothetical protein